LTAAAARRDWINLTGAEAPADKRVRYAELVYPFGETAPKTLTMIPPLDDEGRASVSIGFIVHHKSVPVIATCASLTQGAPSGWRSRPSRCRRVRSWR
jgi:hypothetical protein